MFHTNKHCTILFLLLLTCFNSIVDRICASGFLLDIRYFNYSTFLVHGYCSAFLLLDISSSWSLVDVFTWCIQSMIFTLRYSYPAFPNPVKTLHSTFLLPGTRRFCVSLKMFHYVVMHSDCFKIQRTPLFFE